VAELEYLPISKLRNKNTEQVKKIKPLVTTMKQKLEQESSNKICNIKWTQKQKKKTLLKRNIKVDCKKAGMRLKLVTPT